MKKYYNKGICMFLLLSVLTLHIENVYAVVSSFNSNTTNNQVLNNNTEEKIVDKSSKESGEYEIRNNPEGIENHKVSRSTFESDSEAGAYHDFSPPSSPGGGVYLMHSFLDSNADTVVKKVIETYLIQKLTIGNDETLGANKGDSMVIKISSKQLHHYFIPIANNPATPYVSIYGYVEIGSLSASSISSSLDIKTNKVNDGFEIEVTRMAEETKDSYDVEIDCDFIYPYYTSAYYTTGAGYQWSAWKEQPSSKLSSQKHSVSIKAEPKVEELTAVAIPQEVDLEIEDKALSSKTLVKDVKFGSKVLSESDYTVSMIEVPNLVTVGEKKAKVKITYGNEKLELDIPIKVNWGNTIHLKGGNYNSVLAISIPSSANPKLVLNKGIDSGSGNVHNSIKGKYMEISHLRDSYQGFTPISTVTIDGDADRSSSSEDAKALSTYEFYTKDVLKISHVELKKLPEMLDLYIDSQKTIPNTDKHMLNDDLYLARKGKQFRVLNFNHLESKKSEIPINSDKEYLDTHIEEFIDKKGFDNINLKFKSYPETSTPGIKKASIIARELVEGTSYIEKTYSVSLEVKPTIEAETIPQEVSIGADISKLNLKSFLKNVRINGTAVSSDDYDIEIVSNIETNLKGMKNLILKIIDKNSGAKSDELTVPITVDLYNAFLFKGVDSQTTLSLSIINEDNELSLVANRYNNTDEKNEMINPNFNTDKEYFSIKIMEDVPDNLEFYSGFSPTKVFTFKGGDINSEAYKKFSKMKVKEGDLIRVYHYQGENNGGNSLLTLYKKGKQSLIDQDMFTTGYYQFTKEGFVPVNVTRLSAYEQNVKLGTSKAELDKLMPNIIDDKGKENITAGGYTTYPNTGLVGIQNGGVRVYEKLISGNRVKYYYTVPFNIEIGNTLQLNGANLMDVFGLSILNENNKLSLVPSQLSLSKEETAINKNFVGKTYYETKLFSIEDNLVNITKNDAYYSQSWLGEDSSKDAYNKFKQQDVKEGNILYVYHAEGDYESNINKKQMIERYSSSQLQSEKSDKENYYEITKSGYNPLHFNHLGINNSIIPIYSTKSYLDEHIEDYIDLKGYDNVSVKEFSQYPNTRSSGSQTGKIVVEELLSTGKKVQYEYEVTFTIQEGELTLSAPKILDFQDFSKSKIEQLIQRKKSENLELSVKDSRGEGKQGGWRLTAQVNQSEALAPYLIFRNSNTEYQYLNQGAVEIYSQSKQEEPTEPLNVEVSGKWTEDTGILLKVPSKNNLSSEKYTSTITWNLVEGP